MKIVLLFLVLAFSLHSCTARGVWGARKRKTESDGDLGATTFEERRIRASNSMKRQLHQKQPNRVKTSDSNAALQQVNSFFDIIDAFVLSDEFDVPLDSLRAIFDQYPSLGDISDFSHIKEAMDQGESVSLKRELIALLHKLKNSILSLISNPNEIEALIDHFPHDIQDGIRTILSSRENLSEIFGDLMSSGINPNDSVEVNRILSTFSKTLQDSEFQNQVRQVLLSQIELWEALGIRRETIESAEAFEELVSLGVKALQENVE